MMKGHKQRQSPQGCLLWPLVFNCTFKWYVLPLTCVSKEVNFSYLWYCIQFSISFFFCFCYLSTRKYWPGKVIILNDYLQYIRFSFLLSRWWLVLGPWKSPMWGYLEPFKHDFMTYNQPIKSTIHLLSEVEANVPEFFLKITYTHTSLDWHDYDGSGEKHFLQDH